MATCAPSIEQASAIEECVLQEAPYESDKNFCMKILNLGCGAKASEKKEVVNIDWNIYLRIRRNPIAYRAALAIFKGYRRERLQAIPDNILVHDLSQGIPFPDSSVDAVYHSHFLEHLDKDLIPGFFKEVQRVLKKGGLQRIVVPDFESLSRSYLAHLDTVDSDPEERPEHDAYIAEIIEQMVRREASGTSHQGMLQRFAENTILGDARKRGETHQWMYDRVNLAEALENAGFEAVSVQSYDTSGVPDWSRYSLDMNEEGQEYNEYGYEGEPQRDGTRTFDPVRITAGGRPTFSDAPSKMRINDSDTLRRVVCMYVCMYKKTPTERAP